MNYSPAKVLQWYLIANGYAADPANENTIPWPCYVDSLPVSPDNVVVLYNLKGKYDGRLMRGATITHPGIQVYVRATDEATAADKIIYYAGEDIGDGTGSGIFDKIKSSIVTMQDGAEYFLHAFCKRTEPIPLGEEAKGRRVSFAFDGYVTISRLS